MFSQAVRKSRNRAALSFVVLIASCASTVEAGGLLNPASFASLGQLPDEAGAYSVNTSGNTPVMTLPDGTTINGVLDPSGQVAVFTFSSVQLDGSFQTISVAGSRPFALLSQGDMTIQHAVINASASGAVAGPGGFSEGGPGGSGHSQSLGGTGGAGFGGAGGAGGPGYYLRTDYTQTGIIYTTYPSPGAPGGIAYADRSSPLEGGSGAGGAGGGAIELGSTGTLRLVNTDINANGGTLYTPGSEGYGAGGGSGGSISLLGKSLVLEGVEFDAIGGQGDNGYFVPGPGEAQQGAGGGGGGGLVDLSGNLINLGYYADLQGGGGFSAGADGIVLLSAPEPSGIVSGGIAAAAGLAVAIVRKRRRSAGN